jgi:cobalt/nickel transport system permease protein
MHIPDGILTRPTMIVSTTAIAAIGIALGLRKMDYNRIHYVGVIAAILFITSLFHVHIGPTSSHLLLAGLSGLLLGWAVFPAVFAALLLQLFLFGFGGITSLGFNVLSLGIPAVICYYLFQPAISKTSNLRYVFWLAALAGMAGVLICCIIVGAALLLCEHGFAGIAVAIIVSHLPVMIIEGLITGSVICFIKKVRPRLLEKND